MKRRVGWPVPFGLVAVLILALQGCRTSPRTATEPVEIAVSPERAAVVDTPPDWLTEPLSWEKLKHIESWLATDAQRSTDEWRVEGELALNQGRLEFARRDAAKEEASASLASRLRTARAGFARVLGDLDASPQQRERARGGMTRADRLLASLAPAKKGPGVPVIARTAWGALPAHPERMDRTKGPYKKITVHHSADAEPVELDGTLAASAAAVRSIQRAHVNGKTTGYGDIGYHFLIDPSGRVIEGRDLAYQGAHAYGDNNIQNIGVCVLGNFDEDKPTRSALLSLRRVLEHLRKVYAIPRDRVYCHRELRNTVCPGKNLANWVESYRR